MGGSLSPPCRPFPSLPRPSKMSATAPTGERGGFGRGRGGDRRGPRRGPRRGARKVEEIYLFSLPVKEYQIIDILLPKLKDEVMKIMPVSSESARGRGRAREREGESARGRERE